MQGGFSFCGIDIAKFGLEYVPPLDQTYVFAGSDYEVHQESFAAHHGGYFYGTTVQPKDFNLKCFFQDQNINHGTFANIENFFRRGRTGRLVFQKREWVWYTATVVGIDFSDLRNYRNGFITISLRAYYPFARHDEISLNKNNMFDDHISANSGLLEEAKTPSLSIGPVAATSNILLYNGGTEYASLAIALAGDAGEGIAIKNKTTNQSCEFIAFTKGITSDVNKYIITDSLNGKTILTDGVNSEHAFMYHHAGFIELAPSFPIHRNIMVKGSQGSDVVNVMNSQITEDVINKYIYIENKWQKIIEMPSENTIKISSLLSSNLQTYADIVLMNELTIDLAHGANLTKLDFLYKPTFQ